MNLRSPVQELLNFCLVVSALFAGLVVGVLILREFNFSFNGESLSFNTASWLVTKLVGQISTRGPLIQLLPPYIVLLVLLVAVAYCELRFRFIPFLVTLPGMAIGVLLAAVTQHIGLFNSLSGLLIGMLGMWGLGRFFTYTTGEVGLGGGLIYLVGMLGAFVGLPYALMTFMVASLAGFVYSLGARAAGFGLQGLELGPWIAFYGIFAGLLQLLSAMELLSDLPSG